MLFIKQAWVSYLLLMCVCVCMHVISKVRFSLFLLINSSINNVQYFLSVIHYAQFNQSSMHQFFFLLQSCRCIRASFTLHLLQYEHLLNQLLHLARSSCCGGPPSDMVAWVISLPQGPVNDSYHIYFRRNNHPNNCSQLLKHLATVCKFSCSLGL